MWDWLDDVGGWLGGLGTAVEENWLPFTLANQGMSVIARMQAEKALARERNAILEAEQRRQAAYQQQANAQIAQAMQRLTPAAMQQGQQAGADLRVQANEERARPAEEAIASGEYSGVSPDAPKVVKENAAREIAKSLQKGRDYSRTQSALGGFGDAQLGAQIGLNRTGQSLNQLSSFSRGSSGIVPLELEGAQGAGYPYRVAHDIFGGLSDIGQIYGINAMKKKRPGINYDPTMSYIYGTGSIDS